MEQWLACWTRDEVVRSAAGSCGTLEICWDRGLRVFGGLAVVGKSEGLTTPIGARALFFAVDLSSTTLHLTSLDFLSLRYCRRLEILIKAAASF